MSILLHIVYDCKQFQWRSHVLQSQNYLLSDPLQKKKILLTHYIRILNLAQSPIQPHTYPDGILQQQQQQ